MLRLRLQRRVPTHYLLTNKLISGNSPGNRITTQNSTSMLRLRLQRRVPTHYLLTTKLISGKSPGNRITTQNSMSILRLRLQRRVPTYYLLTTKLISGNSPGNKRPRSFDKLRTRGLNYHLLTLPTGRQVLVII
jgi:hypothetical protein